MSSTEPPHRLALRALAADVAQTRQTLSAIVVHHDGQPDVVAALAPTWQEWPGLQGCYVYHVPRRAGDTGPYLAICDITPAVLSEGAHLDESRLIAILEGSATLNGQLVRVGEVRWIAPGEPLSWLAGPGGCLCAIRYDVPPHDLDPDLLPPS